MSARHPEPLDPELQALLDDERQAPGAPAAARQRVASRLSISVAAGLSGAAGVSGAASQTSAHALPAAGAKAVFAWKWMALGLSSVAVVAGAAGVWRALQPRPAIVGTSASAPSAAAPPAPLAAPVAVVAALDPVSAPTVPVGPAPTGVPRVVAGAAPAAAQAATEEPAAHHRHADVSAEHSLVEGARAALQRNDVASALRLCARHGQLFPRGSLVEERDSVVILALGAAHRAKEATARAARFRARYPGSLFLPAVEAALANADAP